ncbi:hypothetical protein J5Y03_19595 [Bacillus sp. RG28]|uniref:Uncharacterized protein n=1 Tax=Gottfriedia endophytica TaxID=2820819 RepID=A0A940NYC8_9BACI|nr:hypothetical protein [Gottfriedia endophytica]MBP0727348.1 hypothetical protein [Gottfriedia endophytica]
MGKILLFILSFIWIATSFWILYDAYTPKAGPIGNSVNTNSVYIGFISTFSLGILLFSIALILNYSDENRKLRFLYILLNIVFYLMFIGVSGFVIINWNGLKEIDRLPIWVISMLLLLFVSLLQSFRIRTWVIEGKL